MDRKKRLARAVKRYAETVEPPFRTPGWIGQTAASLGPDHPLAGVLQQAAEEQVPIHGLTQSSGWRPWQTNEQFSPNDYFGDPSYHEWRSRGMSPYETPKPETHELGDGVTASVTRRPMENSPGFEHVHVSLKHAPTGRTGAFSINRKV